MPQKKDLCLTEYGIDKYQYRELSNFCLQYIRKKRRVSSLFQICSVHSQNDSLDSHNRNRQHLQNHWKQDCQLIEQTASEIDPIIAPFLIENITAEIPYEHLSVPCGRRQFYAMRRYFFYLLAKKRYMI